MPEVDGRAVEAGKAFAGAPQHVGWFRFHFADQRWEWSEQLQRMHGYEPGRVTPTTELVLEHKHPDDRHQIEATIDEMMRTQQAFSTRHRIVDTCGDVHHVVVVGDRLVDGQGEVVGTHGYYIDITRTADRGDEDAITARVAEITRHRAVIEQAKGMLMLVYGLDESAAFDLLRWRSQSGNVKLRVLAERIVAEFRQLRENAIRYRAVFDHALLSVADGGGEVTSAAN